MAWFIKCPKLWAFKAIVKGLCHHCFEKFKNFLIFNMENLKLMVCFCRKILSVKRNLGKERMANNGRDGNGN